MRFTLEFVSTRNDWLEMNPSLRSRRFNGLRWLVAIFGLLMALHEFSTVGISWMFWLLFFVFGLLRDPVFVLVWPSNLRICFVSISGLH